MNRLILLLLSIVLTFSLISVSSCKKQEESPKPPVEKSAPEQVEPVKEEPPAVEPPAVEPPAVEPPTEAK